MTTVNQLLKTKGQEIWSVGPDNTVFDALKLLAEKEVGIVLVLDREQLVGVFSERDYARKGILHGRAAEDTPVKDVMSTQVLYVGPDQTVEECMALMTNKDIRHLPVLEDTALVGLVSVGDLVKSIISEQEFMIEQLASYIMTPPTPPVAAAEAPTRSAILSSFVGAYQPA